MTDDWPEFTRSLRPRLAYALASALLLVVVGLVAWKIRVDRDSSRARSIRMKIGSVSLALKNYRDVHGCLPPPAVPGQDKEDDRSLYSWRVEIVPFLESWHGSWDASRRWDNPVNAPLVELSSFYSYDSDGPYQAPRPFPETNLVAITGPGTAFDESGSPKSPRDVAPYAILAVETRRSGIPWPAPGDFDIRTMPRTINAPDGSGISGQVSGGFHLIFASGEFWFLSNKVPFEALEKFFKVADASKNDVEKMLGPFVLHRGP